MELNDQAFLIVPSTNPNKVCVTAGLNPKDPVKLEKITNARTQLWTTSFQINKNGSNGIAVINWASGKPMSVTMTKEGEPLVMMPFSPYGDNKDCWSLTGAGEPWIFRLVWPWDTSWSWNDKYAQETAGDTVFLFNDKNPNSIWRIALPTL